MNQSADGGGRGAAGLAALTKWAVKGAAKETAGVVVDGAAGEARPQEAEGWLNTVLRPLIRLLLIGIGEFQRNELSLRASALTYTVLLSLVPFLALSTAVIKGLGGDDQMRQLAYSYVNSLEQAEPEGQAKLPEPGEIKTAPAGEGAEEAKGEPPARLTEHLHDALEQIFDYVDRTDFATLGSLGMAGILLSVLLVLNHIEAAMNAIWKVERGRTLLRKFADYIALLIVLPIAGNIAFAAAAFLESPALAAWLTVLIPFAWLHTLLLKMVPVLVIALVLYAIYIFFPNTKVETPPALCSATLAAIGWFSLQNLYISLQVGVANYNAIYGSFASLPLFLVWVYLGWLFILGGAQMAFAWQHRQSFQLLPPSSDPALRLACAMAILARVRAALAAGKGLQRQELAESIDDYPTQLSLQIIDELTDAGHLHLSQRDNRLLPAQAGGSVGDLSSPTPGPDGPTQPTGTVPEGCPAPPPSA